MVLFPIPHLLMPLDSDSKGVVDDMIVKKFQESSPDIPDRSSMSIIERLRKMQDTYKFGFDDNVADLVDLSLTILKRRSTALLAKLLGGIEPTKNGYLQRPRRCASNLVEPSNSQTYISQTIFDAMDAIWSDEPTTCPLITIDAIDDTPIVEASRRSVRSTPRPGTPSPGAFSDATDESESPNASFNTGKKVRARGNKLDDVLSVITENLEIQAKAVELKEKSIELQEKHQREAIERKEKHHTEAIERKEKDHAKVIELKEKQQAKREEGMNKLNATLDKSVTVQEELASTLQEFMQFMMRGGPR